ncbi:3641_t:CDS:2 [Entrophospora sp. SA101]|nr:3641_t:CDS:2 [Entrophospora sp. SA101]
MGYLKNIIGEGILAVDGDVHKKQRKLMSPSFSNHTFTRVSNTLKYLWKDEIKNGQNVNNDIGKKSAIIDVGCYMGRVSLDVIGIVGFDSEINSLIESSRLADSLSTLFDNKYGVAFNLLSISLPILRLLPLKINQDIENASIEIEKLQGNCYGQEIDKNEQMSFEEIRNQIMTFFIAGHESTGVMMIWILYYLSKDQEIQDKLREEIVKEFPDKDSELNFDKINSMEYLNAVCKETLRIVPPATLVSCIANVEKVKGFSHYKHLPFSAGPRSCIGNRFALNEAKVVLCILLRNFQFHEVEGFKVTTKANITLRPDPTVKLWW